MVLISFSISDNKKFPFNSDDNIFRPLSKFSNLLSSLRVKLCLIKKFPFNVSVNCLDSTMLHLNFPRREEILATIPIWSLHENVRM